MVIIQAMEKQSMETSRRHAVGHMSHFQPRLNVQYRTRKTCSASYLARLTSRETSLWTDGRLLPRRPSRGRQWAWWEGVGMVRGLAAGSLLGGPFGGGSVLGVLGSTVGWVGGRWGLWAGKAPRGRLPPGRPSGGGSGLVGGFGLGAPAPCL